MYVVGTHWQCVGEELLMGTYNICFDGQAWNVSIWLRCLCPGAILTWTQAFCKKWSWKRAITLIILMDFTLIRTWPIFYEYIPVYKIWIQYTDLSKMETIFVSYEGIDVCMDSGDIIWPPPQPHHWKWRGYNKKNINEKAPYLDLWVNTFSVEFSGPDKLVLAN